MALPVNNPVPPSEGGVADQCAGCGGPLKGLHVLSVAAFCEHAYYSGVVGSYVCLVRWAVMQAGKHGMSDKHRAMVYAVLNSVADEIAADERSQGPGGI